MKGMIGYIYLMTDTTNGKQYVGQHHYHKEELDPNYHGSGIIVTNIFKKRPETIKEEYLKTCYSQREMDEWEKYFIFTNNTLHPNGYNLEEGGRGGVPSEETRRKISEARKGTHLSEETKQKLSEINRGTHLSEETRRKISETNKGRHHSEETRWKISEAHKGRKKKPLSEEHKKKIGEANKGRHYSEETRRKISEALTNGKLSKTVLQFTPSGEFIREWPSANECGRNGFVSGNVTKCCRGKFKTHKGFIWRYKER